MSRLKSVDAGHHPLQNLLFSCMLSKNIMKRYTKLDQPRGLVVRVSDY